jgi:hypothetical protein
MVRKHQCNKFEKEKVNIMIASTDEQRLKIKDALQTMQRNELIELREEIEKAIAADPTVVKVDESILSVKGAEETVVIDAFGKSFMFKVPAGAMQRYPVLDDATKACTLVADGEPIEPSSIL